MDQTLATRRKEFNAAVDGFGLDKAAAESLWSYASSVGMQIDDFTLSILLYGARQEKTARDAENRIRETIAEFDTQLNGCLDRIVEAATKETVASNAKIAAGLGDEIAKAVETAVDKAAENDRQESVARERRTTITAASICVCGILAVGGLTYATGYVSGRDNAIITASRFEALAKDPAAGQAIKVFELNGPGVFGSDYCGRGSNTYRVVEGIELCSPTVKISGPKWTPTQGLKGLSWRVAATVENWTATASAWLLLLVGAAGGLMIRKGLRNFGRLGPIRWLLDTE
jgi:hypothetical protein